MDAELIVEQWRVADVLPHRGDMLFIDTIDYVDDDCIVCGLHSHPSAFVDAKGRVPAWVGMEYMCQAVAALEGIRRLQHGYPITLSFVIGSRRMLAAKPFFQIGQPLHVSAQVDMRDNVQLGVYRCQVKNGSELLLSAMIKGVMPDNLDMVFG